MPIIIFMISRQNLSRLSGKRTRCKSSENVKDAVPPLGLGLSGFPLIFKKHCSIKQSGETITSRAFQSCSKQFNKQKLQKTQKSKNESVCVWKLTNWGRALWAQSAKTPHGESETVGTQPKSSHPHAQQQQQHGLALDI